MFWSYIDHIFAINSKIFKEKIKIEIKFLIRVHGFSICNQVTGFVIIKYMSFYLAYAIIVDPQLVGLKVGCYIKNFSRVLNNDIAGNKAVYLIRFYKKRCDV